MYFRHACLTRDGSGEPVITHRAEHDPAIFRQSRQITVAYNLEGAAVAICSNKDMFAFKMGRKKSEGRLNAGLHNITSRKSDKNLPVFSPVMETYSQEELQSAINKFLVVPRSRLKEANGSTARTNK